MVDRVSLVGDALVGSMDRFRDPVAFVFTFLDYLVVAFGVEGGIIAEVGDQAESESSKQAPWRVSTLPVGYECGSETKPLLIGGVRFTICGRVTFDTVETHDSLATLKRWFASEYPSFSEVVTQQFKKASQVWVGKSLPHNCFAPSDTAPEATRAIYDSIWRGLRESMGNSLSGAIGLNLALAFANGERQMKVWQAVDGNLPRDEPAMPEAVLRAFATGFAQWSTGIDERCTLAVPCAVGGFPWAVIYSECPSPAWLHGYHLYRDVLPRLLEDIRGQARNAYLSALIGTTDAEFSRENPSTRFLRERWEDVSRSFPFSVPQLPEELASEGDGPDVFATGLQRSAVLLLPVRNQNFLSVVGNEPSQTWGDIADMATVLGSAIGSRLGVASLAKANVAQAIAHEFKNLTADLAVVAQDLERKAWALDTPANVIGELAKVIGIQGQQLNGVSLALFELATPGAESRFEASDDSIYLLRAAVRIMLELRSMTQAGFAVEDTLSFEDSVALLRRTYGSSQPRPHRRRRDGLRVLARLINVMPVAFLLAAAAEPVRNVRIVEQLQGADETARAWTDVDVARSEVLLLQETVEAPHTPRGSILSRGAVRANRLFPRTFCRIDPSVRPVDTTANFRLTERGGVVVVRETRIRVFVRPTREET